MATYYNEYEPYAAEWLRNLIKKGLIPNGEVDTRSILNVAPDDLRGFTQCHFFAGLGGWAYAGRLAGWPDDRPIWTGSAPCQPFSTAGQQKGTADERHLWPVFFGLIRACRPPVVMGEQVAAAVGKDWLDGVSTDLEGIGYACGAVVVPACAVDAPHRRDRLWFVGSLEHAESVGGHGPVRGYEREAVRETVGAGGVNGGIVAHTGDHRAGRISGAPAKCGRHALDAGAEGIRQGDGQAVSGGLVSRGEGDVADAGQVGRDGWASPAGCETGANAGAEGRRGHWDTYQWAIGSDGKARRVEPSIRLLAHGVPARVGKLRAFGNAIVAPLAAEIITAYMETQCL